MDNEICGIYRITMMRGDLPCKYYIGQSAKIRFRQKEHLRTLRRGAHYNAGLQADYDLFGPSAVIFDIIEICEPDAMLLTQLEQAELDRHPREAVYNVRIECVRSPLGTSQTPESNSKRSVALTGYKRSVEEIEKSAKNRTGQKRSLESRMRMSAAGTGRKLSAEHRENISKGLQNYHSNVIQDSKS